MPGRPVHPKTQVLQPEHSATTSMSTRAAVLAICTARVEPTQGGPWRTRFHESGPVERVNRVGSRARGGSESLTIRASRRPIRGATQGRERSPSGRLSKAHVRDAGRSRRCLGLLGVCGIVLLDVVHALASIAGERRLDLTTVILPTAAQAAALDLRTALAGQQLRCTAPWSWTRASRLAPPRTSSNLPSRKSDLLRRIGGDD